MSGTAAATGLDHLVIGVHDLDAAGAFYEALSSLPVPVRPHRTEDERVIRARPAATFVAQLLAERLAPVRRRRRGDREEVDARYHAADPASRPTASGSLIRRDI